MTQRTKWAGVTVHEDGRLTYFAGRRDTVAWTYDPEEALMFGATFAMDAEALVFEWPWIREQIEGERADAEAQQ